MCAGTDKFFFTSFAARDKTYVMLFRCCTFKFNPERHLMCTVHFTYLHSRLWQNALLDSPASQSEIWSWVRSKCDWSSAQDFGFNSKVFECILEARVKEHWKRIINSVCCHRDLFKAFYSCLSVKRPLLEHWNSYIPPQVQAIYGEQQASRCVFHLFKSFEVFFFWSFFVFIPSCHLTMPSNICIF